MPANRVTLVARNESSDFEAELEAPPGLEPVYLLDASSGYEEEVLKNWLRRRLGGDPAAVRIRSSRRGKGGDAEELTQVATEATDRYLIPVRIAWLAPERSGTRSVSWSDVLKLGDPRDPRGLRARFVRMFRRSRMQPITGAGASTGELAARHSESETLDSLASFVTRRAWRALDITERRLRGNRYKTPHFVPEAIFSRREFKKAILEVGVAGGLSTEVVEKKARAYLEEIAATHSPMVIDLVANAIHKLYRQGYGEIKYLPEEVEEIARLGEGHPVVFLPSHRSNLDRLSLQFMLWENDLPPNHTAGGINLNFFPIGPLLRRTGVFFIRRSFRDNELYKTVLQHYLDYLIEKRFNLEWYLEGGRSRSGRLLPPKMGLLNYVVDAQRRGKSDDVILIPLSIAYDQIQDVPDYAREARGESKESESLGWLYKAIRSMRKRYGDIHIRFGSPVSVASFTGDANPDAASLAVQKLAFEVMYRIGQVTPVTPTAVVSIALLAARGSAKTAAELRDICAHLIGFIDDRQIPTTDLSSLAEPAGVTAILDWLKDNENVSSHEALGRRVFWLEDEQMIRISYYRNMVVHFFLNRAIAEIALGSLVDAEEVSVDRFNEKALEIRDLLKFEFFFPEKDEFLKRVSYDMSIDVPGWMNMMLTGGPGEVLEKLGQPVSGWALVPFLDAYQIVADELESASGEFAEKTFLADSLDRARMYRIEDQSISGESASQILFKSAIALARNRELLESQDQLSERRRRFASEVREVRSIARSLSRASY